MRTTSRSRAAALAVALSVPLAVAPRAAAAQTPTTPPADSARVIELQVPPSVGAFVMRQRHDYENHADGVLLRFIRADSLVADVFVYPGPDFARDCALACARDVMRREVADFVSVIPELIRRQYVDTLSVASDDSLVPAAGDAWRLGRHLTLRERVKGRAQSSDFYLYYLPGFRVKVRASYPTDSARTAAIAEFAAALVPALIAPPASAAATAAADSGDAQHIGISLKLSGPASTARARVATALASLGYTLADSATERRIVTAPRFAWPKGSEKEAWHGAESPGVVLVVGLSGAAGDSTAVEIGGQSPVRAGWRDAKVAQMLEMLSVMELAAEIGEKKKTKSR